MRRYDPAAVAGAWKRPYTSVQWAWVRALGIEPSAVWADGTAAARRGGPRRSDLREAMRQRVGVRGL